VRGHSVEQPLAHLGARYARHIDSIRTPQSSPRHSRRKRAPRVPAPIHHRNFSSLLGASPNLRTIQEPLKKFGVNSWWSDCAQARRSARVIASYCEDSPHRLRAIRPQDAASRLFRGSLSSTREYSESELSTQGPGQNYLYIRLRLSGRCDVALLGNRPAIPGATRLAATTQEHPRC
jgi:hypothetical protein